MKPPISLVLPLLLACGVVARGPQTLPTPIQVLSRSHNRSAVDVYLLCGDHGARWLGAVPAKGSEVFEVSARDARCAEGLNFFLVLRDKGRGYWVGPLPPRAAGHLELVIERYAGLSSASQMH